MSYRTEAEVTKAAKRMCKQLGPAWEPEVWENLGWHSCAVLKFDQSIACVRGKPGSYYAYVSDARVYPAMDTVGAHKRNVRAAVADLVRVLRHQIAVASKASIALTGSMSDERLRRSKDGE